MNHATLRRVALTLAMTLLWPQLGLAQTFDIPASVVGSGGGDLTGSTYSLSGTVGQSAVGSVTGTTYGLDAGYWPQVQALTAATGGELHLAPPLGLVALAGAHGPDEISGGFPDGKAEVRNHIAGWWAPLFCAWNGFVVRLAGFEPTTSASAGRWRGSSLARFQQARNGDLFPPFRGVGRG